MITQSLTLLALLSIPLAATQAVASTATAECPHIINVYDSLSLARGVAADLFELSFSPARSNRTQSCEMIYNLKTNLISLEQRLISAPVAHIELEMRLGGLSARTSISDAIHALKQSTDGIETICRHPEFSENAILPLRRHPRQRLRQLLGNPNLRHAAQIIAPSEGQVAKIVSRDLPLIQNIDNLGQWLQENQERLCTTEKMLRAGRFNNPDE